MRIEMNNINKTIKGVPLLVDINLTLESGHIYGFTGDNGSGKTVLFKVLLGLMHKTSGTILVDGVEQKDLMQDVGFIIDVQSIFHIILQGKIYKLWHHIIK